ncbi:232_t:CDS:2, partial [Funneliformis caledonium]
MNKSEIFSSDNNDEDDEEIKIDLKRISDELLHEPEVKVCTTHSDKFIPDEWQQTYQPVPDINLNIFNHLTFTLLADE